MYVEREDVERRFGAFDLGDGDRSVHRHDRRSRDLLKLLVEERDLAPVAGLAKVEVGGRGPDDVRTAAAEGEGALEPMATLLELLSIPKRTVLTVEEDEFAAPEARRAAGMLSSISASRPCASASSGMSSTSARPRRIASADKSTRPPPAPVEDQVDHREHGVEPLGQQVVGHGEGDAGVADLVLGAGQALAHRLERDEEGARDASVESPPKVRRVRPTWASSASAGGSR